MDTVTDPVIKDGRMVSFDWTAVAAGTRHKGTAVATESEEGVRMVLALDSSEITAEITVTLTPADAGTAMTVTLTARSRGMLAGMFWGPVSDALHRGLVTQVDRFGTKQF
ncbi:MAG: hypothetical protein AAB198_06445 [Actinomycetota bacterium]